MVDQGFKVIDFHCHFPVATNWGGMGGGRGSRGRPESAITGGGAYKSSEESQSRQRLRRFVESRVATGPLLRGARD